MGTPVKHEDLHELAMTYAIKNEMTHEELIKELIYTCVSVFVHLINQSSTEANYFKHETSLFDAEITLKEDAKEIFIAATK